MIVNIAERHELILNKLEEEGFVTVSELSKVFKVSSVTIRKDLTLLEELNLLFRSNGKAIRKNPYIREKTVNEKEKIHHDEKNKIAIKAAQLIKPFDSVILASGTTIIQLAHQIKPVKGMTILTASLNAALIVSNLNDVNVIQLGGIVRKSSSSVIGPLGEQMLSEFNCSKLFLGVDGIDLNSGLTTTSLMEASINKLMIKSAQKIIILADSSKFGRKGFGRICGLEDVDQIITDDGIEDSYRDKLIELGIDVLVV
ncbi:Putative aga operon transcriptional repressor [Polaribacter irgensii 23-P]|jgi:DeoR family transcriptional regulator of aga operon|uniref:Putative aga operon transcriptional repressor n=1 Tax=Polaribacter irgensii 23-P TaxID=313594 RepID=A4BZE6_9FLAO|nr:DeoR/GlpR family DNA-binding transcription regulator [Polaribacter irgensii]EAR12539.1 Putative aga operon transcriptional repressor [Polaribacter irgensii 23-P]